MSAPSSELKPKPASAPPAEKGVSGSEVAVLVTVLVVVVLLLAGVGYGLIALARYVEKSTAKRPEPTGPAEPSVVVHEVPTPTSVTPAEPRPVPAARSVARPVSGPMTTRIVLGAEAALPDGMSIRYEAFDLMHMALTVAGAPAGTEIQLPVLAGFGPVGRPAVLLTASTHVFRVSGAGTFYPVTVTPGLDGFGTVTGGTALALVVPAESPGGRLRAAFDSIDPRSVEWNVRQTLAWIAAENPDLAALRAKRIYEPDPLAPDGRRAVAVADYVAVKQVEGILVAAGAMPEEFRAFGQQAGVVNGLIARLQKNATGKDIESALRTGELDEWVDHPVLQDLLVQWRRTSPRFRTRLAAARLLALRTPDETADTLVTRMVSAGDEATQWCEAMTLFRTGDVRALPVLACYADDRSFGPECAVAVEAAIARAAGQARLPGETMRAYWSRAVGYEKFARPQDRKNLQRAVEEWGAAAEDLAAALADIVSDDPNKAVSAAYRLQRHPRNATAEKALIRVTGTQFPEALRTAALAALRFFLEADLRDVCLPIAREAERRMATQVAQLAVANQFPGFEEVLAEVARHPDVNVRRDLARQVRAARIAEAVPWLIKLQRQDGDASVRAEAARALSAIGSPETVAIIASLLRSGERNSKVLAIELADDWTASAEVLETLAKYPSDPDVGPRIQALLQKTTPPAGR